MHIETITTGAFQENCYVVWCKERQALVFDPGDEADRIMEILSARRLQIQAYVCTHGHTDHINALAALHDIAPAPILMHSADLDWAFEARNELAPYYAAPRRPTDTEILQLDRKQDWEFGALAFQCLHTPGHSPGSCCLLFPENAILIAGDTLFKGSCGRTDLPGGDPRQLR
jgi:hydroxyacylglutathione hydrolase